MLDRKIPNYSTLLNEINNVRKELYNSGISLAELKQAFTFFPKTKIDLRKEEKKVTEFKRGFNLAIKTFRLWRTLLSTNKSEVALTAAYHIIFFSYLSGKRNLV